MKRKLIFIAIIIVLASLVLAAESPYARRIRPVTAWGTCTENEIAYDMVLHKGGICTNAGYQDIVTGSGSVTSVFGRTGVIVAVANDYTFAQLASKPTTIAGYGITDFNSLGDARWSLLAHTHTFASLTSIPTTFSGYGISDTSANLATAITDKLGSGKLIFSAGTLNITSSKTFNVSNNLTLSAIDGSTLAVGTGGTLGTAAYTAVSAYEVPITFSSPLVRTTNNIACTTCGVTGTGLSQFATTTSAALRGVLSDKNGSGVALFDSSTSATFITPILGTPTSITLTNATGLPVAGLSNLGAGVGTFLITPSGANLASALTTALPISKGGTNCTAATITCFNNITGFTASGTTGTTSTSLVFSTSPVLITPDLGTPSAAILTSATGLPLTTGVTGRLAYSNLTQGSALSVLGVNGASTADVTSIAGTANQVLRVNNAGNAIAFSSINLASSNAVTGILAIANGGTGCSVATITCFNNITAFTASGTTGTTSTNLVFSASPTFTGTVTTASTSLGGGTTILKHLSNTATLDFANLAAIGCEDLTITVTNAALGDTVAIGIPNGSMVANGTFMGWVSATNTVSIRFCTVVSGDPASGSFRADVWQH